MRIIRKQYLQIKGKLNELDEINDKRDKQMLEKMLSEMQVAVAER